MINDGFRNFAEQVDKSALALRIKKAIDNKGVSGYRAGADMNMGRSLLGKYMNGEISPSVSNIKLIAEYTNVNLNWLLTGEGDMLTKVDKPFKNEVTPVPEGNYMMVEYVDLRASAGRLGGADVEQLPETHIRLVPKEYKNGGFLVVRVDGDSMYDGSARSLSDGDEVLIKEKKDYTVNELPIKKALFVITSREGNVLKQIAEVNMDGGYIVCRSYNPTYPDFKMYFEDIYQIFIVYKITNKQISLI